MESVPSVVLYFNESSKVALSIPLAQSKTYAIKPLKWLRFLGFTIYGRQGYISKSMNGSELDYTEEIEAREPRFVDVDAMDNRTSSTSDLSTRVADFRGALHERDGTCVFSGDPPLFCHACHLIPHSKGDSYMSSLFDHRREMHGPVDPLDGINDTRNGILLNNYLHIALDAGGIAFLKTPNFALTVDDIPYHQPPDAGSPANRLTLQHISSSPPPTLFHVGPHNSDARQPQDISQWPPAIITDLSYASTALRAWGTKDFIEYIRENSMDSYYEDDDDGRDVLRGPTTPHQPTARAERYERWGARKGRAINPANQSIVGDMDMFDVLLNLPRIRAAREGKRRLPDSDAAVVADNENKIRAWLQSMEEFTS
ncbi:hypothetical protein HD554DRAFT_2191442 [Boletus coccyginus]|nr:hypothetical protein HD554DRAFT_2191442 [Boletus coccyginus]